MTLFYLCNRMKKILSILMLSSLMLGKSVLAQSTDQLHETAKAFMHQGDFSNAVLVLNRALRQMPKTLHLQKILHLVITTKKII